MDRTNYELKNKGLHLVKADKENFWPLIDLRVAKDQEDFVASNAISLAQAYDTLADSKFVQAFGIWDGATPVGFAMIGHNSEEYEEMANDAMKEIWKYRGQAIALFVMAFVSVLLGLVLNKKGKGDIY